MTKSSQTRIQHKREEKSVIEFRALALHITSRLATLSATELPLYSVIVSAIASNSKAKFDSLFDTIRAEIAADALKVKNEISNKSDKRND